jgi:hypothetical protein
MAYADIPTATTDADDAALKSRAKKCAARSALESVGGKHVADVAVSLPTFAPSRLRRVMENGGNGLPSERSTRGAFPFNTPALPLSKRIPTDAMGTVERNSAEAAARNIWRDLKSQETPATRNLYITKRSFDEARLTRGPSSAQGEVIAYP